MMSINEFIEILAQEFFGGNTDIQGVVLYSQCLAVVFLLFARSDIKMTLLLSLPVTLIFTTMGIIPTIMTVLMILVAIIGLVNEYQKAQM